MVNYRNHVKISLDRSKSGPSFSMDSIGFYPTDCTMIMLSKPKHPCRICSHWIRVKRDLFILIKTFIFIFWGVGYTCHPVVGVNYTGIAGGGFTDGITWIGRENCVNCGRGVRGRGFYFMVFGTWYICIGIAGNGHKLISSRSSVFSRTWFTKN